MSKASSLLGKCIYNLKLSMLNCDNKDAQTGTTGYNT